MSHPILLYDGVCGLCNRLVQFILGRDRAAIFRFASLQSPLAASILSRHGVNPTNLDTVYIVIDPNEPTESLRACSDAVLFVLKELRGIWRPLAALLRLIPVPLRDSLYNRIASKRYKLFGRFDSCPIPTPETRNRFLDQ